MKLKRIHHTFRGRKIEIIVPVKDLLKVTKKLSEGKVSEILEEYEWRYLENPRLILASKSKRRRELLKLIGLDFEVISPKVEEKISVSEMPEEIALRLAKLKAENVFERISEGVVIGADTLVVLKNKIFGKPQDETKAREMLRALSGKKHAVITGIYVTDGSREIKDFVSTQVVFKNLKEKEIQNYLEREKPYDKAGAYAIQGRAALFVKEIHGCYFNVVGLPLLRLSEILKDFGFEIL
ncbi:MAG: Maf family protein [Candidatus Methanofastidiosia archaeon]